MKWIVVVIPIFYTTFCLKGQVVDGFVYGQDKSPLAYVNVFSKSVGVLTDETGFFSLSFPNINYHDSIHFSIIGYDPISYHIELVPNQITLKPLNINLEEVVVFPSEYSESEIGFTRRKISQSKITGVFHGQIISGDGVINAGYQHAKYMAIPEDGVAVIESVSVYVTGLGKHKAPFRLRIYEGGDGENGPLREITRESVIAKATKKDDWLTISLIKNKIISQTGGIYVAVEWLQTNKKKYWKKDQLYGQVLGSYDGEISKRSWIKSNVTDWKSTEKGSNDPMIKAKVKY